MLQLQLPISLFSSLTVFASSLCSKALSDYASYGLLTSSQDVQRDAPSLRLLATRGLLGQLQPHLRLQCAAQLLREALGDMVCLDAERCARYRHHELRLA